MAFPLVGLLALIVVVFVSWTLVRRGPAPRQVLGAILAIIIIAAVLAVMAAKAGGWAE